ncbi:hypothetical protein DBR32_01170 [Taibaiella sp. KBW10]|nr:T9SS type A sorting domain-containing protein [Taibaiella sp. KBW10]RQO32250.1 hypothetical protein DBR32_01170 [Taibaiella sp. KBW10]
MKKILLLTITLIWIAFNALQAQIAIPYTEAFSSITAANGFPTVTGGAWTRSGTAAAQPTYIANQVDYNRSGNGDAKFIAFRYDASTRYFFVGPFTLTAGTSYTASVLYKADGLTGFGPLALTYGTAATAATQTNTIVSVPANITNAAFAPLSGAFTPATSGSYFMAIKCTADGNPWYLTLDDYSLTVTPTCFPPATISNAAVTRSGATVSWKKASPVPANGYEYYLSTSSTAPTATSTATGSTTDTFKVLTGLPSATLHYVWVRSICSTTDKSAWTSATTFTTLCATPAPGATLASPNTNLCTGALVTFSLTNQTAGPGVSYAWQSSADGITFTNIASATANTLSTGATDNYYRCRVVCSGGPDTVYSTPVQLTYINNILTSTGAQRCGAGTVSLTATANTGTTINWYNVPTGGTSLGTGSPFTTPSINTTTNYYAEAAQTIQGTLLTIGAGASTGTDVAYNPTNGTYGGMKSQYIFTASELQTLGLTAGNITSLGLEFTTVGSALSGFTMQIGTTTATAFITPITIQATSNTVYTATSFTPIVGINTFVFSSPYNWDGVSNIIVSLSWSNNNSSNSTSTIKYDANTGYMSQSYRKDNETAVNMLSFTGATGSGTSTFDRTQNRPKVILNGTPFVCRSARKPVTATINTAPAFDVTNDKTVCNTAITTLTVNSPATNYNSVTWSPITNLYTDAAATVAYVANANASTVYYKNTTAGLTTYVASANNTTTLCGAVDTVKMQTLPAATTAIAGTGTLCITGTSLITLSPAITQTGLQYQWQNSTNNTAFTDITTNGTGATYTTPTLTATQYYRAVIKNSDGIVCFNSVSDTVLVSNPQVLTTTPASRCGFGPVTLAATTNTNSTLVWYNAATGGAPLATGSPFITPSIASTTNYWVAAKAAGTGGSVTNKVGTGTDLTTTTEELTAFCNRRPSYKMQMIFTQAELNAMGFFGGNITGIGFDITSIGDGATNAAYTVNIGSTTQSTFSTYIATGLNTVYGPSTYTHAVGNNLITFTAPYIWDGASNVVVDITHNGVDALYNAQTYCTTTSSNMTGYSYGTATTATTSIKRPNTTFVFANVCESPRQQVTATVTPPPAFDVTNDKTVCNNAVTTLTVNSPAANFNTVTWSPITNLYTNAAATTAYVANANASTVYYKNTTVGTVMYTANALNTTSQCTNVDTVKIQTLPATATAIAALGTYCQSGATTLSLTPAITQTGLAYQWQNSANNVAFTDITTAGTNATYTTPTLTATQYYRATIKNSDGAVCFNSVSDTVVINNPLLLTTTPAQRCGPGTVTLNATANAGATPVWYTAATGGTSVATGNSYTTPSISATTNYWVAARTIGTGAGSAIVGTGNSLTTTTEELTAFCNRRQNYKMQMIFTAAELNALGMGAGNITGISFVTTTIGDAASNNNFTVKMGATTQGTFTNYITTGLNTAYGPATYTHVVGNNTITFSTPYPWDGTSNVVVEVTHDGIDALYNAQTYYTTTTNNMLGFSYNSSTTATTSNKRLNTVFFYNTLCEGARQQVTATINPKPTATLTPNGTINLCQGAAQTLTGAGTGNYSWLKNNAIIPGQTTNTYSANQTGAYKIVVTNPVGGCSDTSVAANVTVNPKPVVNLGNDTAVCANVTLTLNAGNPGAAYLWNDNSTNSTLAAVNAGQYRVKVTNTFNCATSDTINIAHLPVPVVNLGNDTMICRVQPLTLNAQNPGSAYVWSTGASTQTISVNQAGTYSVSVTNTSNCTGNDAIVITTIPDPINDGFNFVPLFNEAQGKVRFEPIDANSTYTYTWNFGDGGTSNQMTPTHVYTTAGDYLVSMFISNGCTDTTVTLPIRVDFTLGTVTVSKNNINMKLYPNPAQDQLNLELIGDHIFFRNIIVYNVIGQKVLDQKTNKTTAEKISTQQLPAGMYILKAETDKGMVMRKFEIIK